VRACLPVVPRVAAMWPYETPEAMMAAIVAEKERE
jgi:hypothetical protein